jgi:hypothetical protein
MSRAVVWLVVAAGAFSASCGGGRYRVEVALPAGSTPERVLVQVVSSCVADARVVASSTVERSAAPTMELGGVSAGSYGVRALALDASCRVVAEGCVAVEVGGAGGTVRVETAAVTARACTASEACVCTLGDAGPASDAPMSLLDANTCVDCDGVGSCEELLTDRRHCGRCDNPCMGGLRCVGGSCE